MILLAFLFSIPSTFGLKYEEDLEFITSASMWRKGHSFHVEDCLFYSFGYKRDFPYTKIDLSLNKDIDISIKTNGMEAPSGCNIVLIAGK